MFVAGIGTFVARILPNSNGKDWVDGLADGLISDDTAEAVGEFSSSASLPGCGFNPDNVCPGGPNPTYPEYMSPSPSIVTSSELEAGITMTWTPESDRAIANCDDSTDGIRLVVHFADGDLEVRPNSEGNVVIQKTLTHALLSPVMANLYYIDATTGEERMLPNAIKLYGPIVNDDTGACGAWPDPVIDPASNIHYEPHDIFVGDSVYFAFPAADRNGYSTITTCEGDPLDLGNIYFTVDGREIIPAFDGSYYYFETTFGTPSGAVPYLIAINAVDPIRETTASKVIQVYVSSRGGAGHLPSAAISGPYSAHQGDEVIMSGNSDDPDAAYDWIITPPTVPAFSYSGQNLTFIVDEVGRYDVRLTVTSGDGTAQREALHNIDVYPVWTEIPSAVISSNLGYSYHVGDIQTNIACYSDDAFADFSWVVTHPNGTIETFVGDIIPFFAFALEGDYDFKCVVTAGDGATTNYQTRSVGVYPVSLALPPAGMVAPHSAEVGEDVGFSAPSADETLYSYTWDFRDGTPAGTGASVTHRFTRTGTYQVQLTVAYLSDPAISSVVTQYITIVPPSTTAPSYSLSIPYAAEEDTSIPMSIVLSDPADWTVGWQYGDGLPLGSGASVSHAYSNPGKYGIIVTLTSTADPSYEISIPFDITVVPHGNPVPNLAITPGMGRSPLTVTADASGSYVTASGATITNYTFNWGDGSPEESGAASSRSHTFTCGGSGSCSNSVRVTIRDSYGGTSTISAAVVTWP